MFLHAAAIPTATGLGVLLLEIAGAWVFVMAPAAVFFYGGLAAARDLPRALVIGAGSAAITVLLWLGVVAGLVLGSASRDAVFADPGTVLRLLFAAGPGMSAAAGAQLAFIGFEGAVAVATVGIFCASLADRLSVARTLVYSALWFVLVYAPLAFGFGNAVIGWGSRRLGAVDFAGGAFIHVAIGASVLAATLAIGRPSRARASAPPARLPLALVGASLLWVGWLLLTAGEEGAFDAVTVGVFANVFVGSCAGMLGWLIVEKIKGHKPTAVSAACGVFAGVASVAAGANLLTTGWAIIGGAVAAALGSTVAQLGARHRLGPIFDVAAAHLVGGLFGLLYTGVVGADVGIFASASVTQMEAQIIASVVSALWAFGVTWMIGALVSRLGVRVARGTTARFREPRVEARG